MNILFLDDRAVRREVFKTKYPNAEFVETSRDCIYLLARRDFDLVSLDFDLTLTEPDCDGMDVARWIVENKPAIKYTIIHSTNLVGALPRLKVLKDAGYDPLYLPFTFEPCGPFNL